MADKTHSIPAEEREKLIKAAFEGLFRVQHLNAGTNTCFLLIVFYSEGGYL
jgi:hypothetical protein